MEAALQDRFPPALALHHFVVLEAWSGSAADGSSSDGGGGSAAAVEVAALDFLPQDPTSPLTAAALLSGGSVPGAAPTRMGSHRRV